MLQCSIAPRRYPPVVCKSPFGLHSRPKDQRSDQDHNALGITCETGGIKDEERMFRSDRRRLVPGWLIRSELVLPMIPAVLRANLPASSSKYDYIHGISVKFQGLIGDTFQKKNFAYP